LSVEFVGAEISLSTCLCFAYKPKMAFRRRLSPDHEIFSIGNIERHAVAQPREPTRALERGLEDLLQECTIPASVSNRPRCSVCSRILPSEHLLGLHVSEAHDSFFAAQVARGHKVVRAWRARGPGLAGGKCHWRPSPVQYCCFVASCAKKFTSSEARRQHLVSAHSFPETFNFNIVCGRRQAKARGRGGAKPGRRLARPDRRQHSLHKGHGEPSGNAERAAVPSSVLRGMEEMSTG